MDRSAMTLFLTVWYEIVASGRIEEKIIVDTSTVHPDTSVAAAAKLSKSGATFVAGEW
jgi:3-hydroxyisobutyrate dehydrogenase-like beta-hydroxyacid dehydrogenase